MGYVGMDAHHDWDCRSAFCDGFLPDVLMGPVSVDGEFSVRPAFTGHSHSSYKSVNMVRPLCTSASKRAYSQMHLPRRIWFSDNSAPSSTDTERG